MAKSNTKKDINYYMQLPWSYTIETEKDETGDIIYVARLSEIPEVVSDGATIPEALESIKEAMELFFDMSLEAGDAIPEPINKDQH